MTENGGSDHVCRCCLSEDPRTVHGDFILGMCMTCAHLIEGRMRRHRESIEEAISHFEETNVLTQLRELRAEDDGLRADGGISGSERGSKFFDVARFRMSGSAREEFEEMRDATLGSETVLVIARSGTTYRVVPQEDRDDYIDVWGISDHEHPRTGYARFKALGDAELETVPLRTLARLAIRRIRSFLEGGDS